MTGSRVDRDDLLSEALSEFARTLVTDFPIQAILDHLVDRIVEILPVDAVGFSLISPTTDPLFVAGSDSSATRYERLQTELGEGPCLDAYRTGDPVSVPDLVGDARFPRFAAAALAAGVRAVFAFPLRHDDQLLGALDLYRTTPGTLDEHDMEVAQTLADVATVYLLNARTRQARTEFVAAISHELRTPMTTITGFTHLLLDPSSGPLNGTQEKYLTTIERSAQRLRSLADDLLTLASLEPGRPQRSLGPVDLGQVVLTMQGSFGPVIASRDVDATFEVPPDPVMVLGDAHELDSMASNLLSNALKFTEKGGWVRCTLRTRGRRAVLEVSDNGLGIPDAEQPELFTRFFRSSTALDHAIQGSGLGLTIVSSIVKSHGGEITVVSEHLGGSTFTVSLPLLVEGASGAHAVPPPAGRP